MIVYSADPIDYWHGWQKPEQVFNLQQDPGPEEAFDQGRTWPEWERLWAKAQRIARIKLGWEGDIIQGPFVTVLPNTPGVYGECTVIIGWKQHNNGSTFLASELYDLPWVEKAALYWAWAQ